MNKPAVVIVIGVIALCTAQAQVPSILNYQGRVTVGGTNFNGTGSSKLPLFVATRTRPCVA